MGAVYGPTSRTRRPSRCNAQHQTMISLCNARNPTMLSLDRGGRIPLDGDGLGIGDLGPFRWVGHGPGRGARRRLLPARSMAATGRVMAVSGWVTPVSAWITAMGAAVFPIARLYGGAPFGIGVPTSWGGNASIPTWPILTAIRRRAGLLAPLFGSDRRRRERKAPHARAFRPHTSLEPVREMAPDPRWRVGLVSGRGRQRVRHPFVNRSRSLSEYSAPKPITP